MSSVIAVAAFLTGAAVIGTIQYAPSFLSPATASRLVFTADGETASVSAERITQEPKGKRQYRLSGNFLVVGPNGWEHHGRDARLSVYEGRGGTLLSLTTRHPMKQIIPVAWSTEKRTILTGRPGSFVSATVPLGQKAVPPHPPTSL